jgi:hypothetical protein
MLPARFSAIALKSWLAALADQLVVFGMRANPKP